jgi:putative ABC transport system permease protein
MLKNYLKITIRNIVKHKGYFSINIVGLAISIAACILISLWVVDELSYDKFNKNSDRIYRVYGAGKVNKQDLSFAMTAAPLGETLHKDCPEVETYTRIWAQRNSPVIRYGGKIFNEKHFLYADSTFFEVFTANFIMGNAKTALVQPGTVVLTETTAHRYFGDANPLGAILNLNKNDNYTVTGVIKDFPNEAHFHFNFLGSLSSINSSRNPSWLESQWYTYLLLKPGTNIFEFQKKLNVEFRKYFGPQLLASTGISLKQLEMAGNKFNAFLQPITSIHLHSKLSFEIEPNSSMDYIYIFSTIAIAILLIACINFVNLSTARSERRAKEVGIRKTLGSPKLKITLQFIMESVITSLLASVLAVGFVEFMLPLFNKVTDKEISLNLLSNIYTLPIILCLAILTGLLAGVYPAFYLSSFQPAQVLKSKLVRGRKKGILRDGLVVLQFSISIVLVIGTFIIHNQMKYIQDKNLGFNKEQVITLKTSSIGNNIYSFEHELMSNSSILSVSNSSTIPGEMTYMSSYKLKGESNTQIKDAHWMTCDDDFLKTYQLKLASGRFFSSEHPSDTMAVIINEAAAKLYGIKDIESKYLVDPSDVSDYKIIGVVKDFNFKSLHEAVFPLVLYSYKPKAYGDFLSVRIKPGDYAGAKSFIENTWRKYAGNEALNYSFLDQSLQKMYLSDQRTNKIAAIFSALAIFIACLGLFGLATYVTEQRTKEIGIRKVLGASVPEIILMLSKEFTKWVVIANVIAWPVAYYFMDKWLQDFAYKTNISIWIFALSGALALVIALLTVSTNAIKAATANPVKSLKYE